MKIALAIENFSRHGGGAEAYAVALAQTLVSEGWEVHLFGHSWDGEPGGAIFHHIPGPPRWVPPSLRLIHFALRHRSMVRQEHFDVVLGFGNTIEMNVYQSHGGVHYLSNMRKLQAVSNPVLRMVKALALFATPKYHARAWIEGAAFRARPRPVIVAISDMVRNDMADYFRVPKEDIRLVYNGIDVAKFSAVPSSAGKELSSGFPKCGDEPGLPQPWREGAVPDVGAGFIPARPEDSRIAGGDKPRPYPALASSSFGPAGYTQPYLQKGVLRKRLGFNGETLFLFMAYDFRKKGVSYLIQAAGKLLEKTGPGRFGVVVVGRPPSPSLSRLVRKLQLEGIVVFPGSTKEPETFYSACDVFILPTFYDACSLVVFEAMAAGLPAITTRYNGAAGILTDTVDGKVLRDPSDVGEMASAMELFLDKKTLEEASAAARRTASQYTLEANHRQMLGIFNELVSRPSGPKVSA